MEKWLRFSAGKINALTTNDWLWFASDDYIQSQKNKTNSPSTEITGKYLFFHPDPKILTKVATDEISHDGFHLAKINKKLAGKNSDHVLCLYYKDDSRKDELATKYQGKDGIKYRYWKSNEDTRKGKYSKEFLDGLDRDLRNFRF